MPSVSPCVAGLTGLREQMGRFLEMQHKADLAGLLVLPQSKLLGASFLLLRDNVIQKKQNGGTPTRVLLSGQSHSLASN